MLAYFYGYVLIGVAFCFIPKISNVLHETRVVLRQSDKNTQPDFKLFAKAVMFGMVCSVIFLWPLEIPSLLKGKK